MSKQTKTKKDKVQKLTEAEYAAYLESLKGMTEGENGGDTVGSAKPAKSETE